MRLVILVVAVAVIAGPIGCGERLTRSQRQAQNSGDTPNSPYYGVQVTAETKLRLGTRQFVASRLAGVFAANLPDAAKSTALSEIDRLVLSEPGYFGGPCDRYRGGYPYFDGYDSNGEPLTWLNCQGPDSQSSVIPTVATARLALTIRACDKMLSDDTVLRHAIAQALSVASVATPALPGDTEIAKAYDLFYPGVAMPPSILAGLRGVVQQSQSLSYGALEAWRFVLLALCQSPDWQIP